MGLPRIAEVGRLAAPPELRFTQSGKAVCSMRLVFSKRRKNEASGEWEDVGTLWVDATAWEQVAENIAESGLDKGSEVLVIGELYEREYEKRDGSGKGKSLELRVYHVGPDLTRATARVSKVSRDGQGAPKAKARVGGGGDPWGSAGGDDQAPF
jgi:single-strand DNA-binding protein